MKHSLQKDNSISSAAALLVFAVFAVFVVLVLLLSAGTYQKISSRDQESWQMRTVSQYLESKVRQMDADGSLSAGSLGEGDALIFTETVEGERYATWIYCHDGWLREFFAEASMEPDPAAGEPVLEAADLQVELSDGRVCLSVELDGAEPVNLCIQQRSGREGVL